MTSKTGIMAFHFFNVVIKYFLGPIYLLNFQLQTISYVPLAILKP